MDSFSDICDASIKKWLQFVINDSVSHSQHLTFQAQQLIEKAFFQIQPEKLVDYHVHLIGMQTAYTGNFVHSNFFSWRHPFLHLAALAFEIAFGIKDRTKADQEAVERLLHLIREMPMHGKYCLLAFDCHYDDNGFFDLVKSKIHVSNEYIFRVASQHQHVFIPSISIHPYRADAIDELQKWAERKVKIVKWMPNAMGMNPMDQRCIPYYNKMRELDLILLTHIGHESAVPVTNGQELGNPLLLRRALDQGVKVIMAHCGTLGKGKNFDQNGRKEANFDLFLKLMDEPAYQNRLYGDLAAVTQINRMNYLPTLIKLSQPGQLLHNRLVNGSDYPLPTVNFLISTKLLQRKGLLTREEREGLNDIYQWNPLLFDFVLKRTLRHPQSQERFPAELFMVNQNLNILT